MIESRQAATVAVVSALVGASVAAVSCSVVETNTGIPVSTQRSIAHTLCIAGQKYYETRPAASSETARMINSGVDSLEDKGVLDPDVQRVVDALQPVVGASAQMDAATARAKGVALAQACARL